MWRDAPEEAVPARGINSRCWFIYWAPALPPAGMRTWLLLLASASALAQTAGGDKSATTRALETGARLLQSNAPAAALDVHLSGFHPLKDDPSHQMHAHHFCRQLNEDLMQCALFDGSTADARLNGIEYIVSARLYATLPAEERRFWHPHNGEILSGQLLAPGRPRRPSSNASSAATARPSTPGPRVMRCRWARRGWRGPSAATANCAPTCCASATACSMSTRPPAAVTVPRWCRWPGRSTGSTRWPRPSPVPRPSPASARRAETAAGAALHRFRPRGRPPPAPPPHAPSPPAAPAWPGASGSPRPVPWRGPRPLHRR